MDDEAGPAELVFHNPKTGHFSVFDRERLLFDKKWHAYLYAQCYAPPPPPGVLWMTVVGFDPLFVPYVSGCVPMRQLMDEVHGVTEAVAEGRPLYEILVQDLLSRALYRYFPSRDYFYGSEKEARVDIDRDFLPDLEWTLEWVPILYNPDRSYPLLPFCQGGDESEEE